MPSGWRDQYDRMMRWHAVLAESADVTERRVDEFYAFFGCAFHLKNWLENDFPASGIARGVEALVNERLWLRLCADIANGSKHSRLTRRVRFDAEARVERAEAAFDPGAFDPGAFQTKDMIVVPAGGTAWDAMRVADGCVAAWKDFLGERGLLGEGQ